MVKQYITRTRQPLFIESELQAISAPAREELIGTEEIDPSAIKPLVESISGKNIDKILGAVRITIDSGNLVDDEGNFIRTFGPDK